MARVHVWLWYKLCRGVTTDGLALPIFRLLAFFLLCHCYFLPLVELNLQSAPSSILSSYIFWLDGRLVVFRCVAGWVVWEGTKSQTPTSASPGLDILSSLRSLSMFMFRPSQFVVQFLFYFLYTADVSANPTNKLRELLHEKHQLASKRHAILHPASRRLVKTSALMLPWMIGEVQTASYVPVHKHLSIHALKDIRNMRSAVLISTTYTTTGLWLRAVTVGSKFRLTGLRWLVGMEMMCLPPNLTRLSPALTSTMTTVAMVTHWDYAICNCFLFYRLMWCSSWKQCGNIW